MIIIPLSLLVIISGMFLLAKTKKEDLGLIYKIVSYISVLAGTAMIVCSLLCNGACNKGYKSCCKYKSECKKSDTKCSNNRKSCNYSDSNCKDSCKKNCKDSCKKNCKDRCKKNCEDSCKKKCKKSCKDSCKKNCKDSCKKKCKTANNKCSKSEVPQPPLTKQDTVN